MVLKRVSVNDNREAFAHSLFMSPGTYRFPKSNAIVLLG